MAKTLKDHLDFALESLEEGDFKRFKRTLNDAQVEDGYDKIPRGRLEKADTMDVAELIISYYRQEYGLRLTLEVLQKINTKDVAETLRSAAGADGPARSTAPPLKPSTGGAGARPSGKHFVDKHREDIIQRCTLVDPILDRLFSLDFLTQEQYDFVRVMNTTQNKMRELYRLMLGWGESDKDQFYQALKEQNGPLIRDLGGR
ncbi:apoptosis-associated speck-like protein containing a CARD [Lissotriton helveticus]